MTMVTRTRPIFISLLVDTNGQLIASAGATEELDTTALASLTTGNIEAAGGLGKLISEREFALEFRDHEKDALHISIAAAVPLARQRPRAAPRLAARGASLRDQRGPGP